MLRAKERRGPWRAMPVEVAADLRGVVSVPALADRAQQPARGWSGRHLLAYFRDPAAYP